MPEPEVEGMPGTGKQPQCDSGYHLRGEWGEMRLPSPQPPGPQGPCFFAGNREPREASDVATLAF